MSNDIIFYTQISTIFAFVISVFVLYRLLVSQKDGVIELLRERIRQYEIQVKELQANSPDVLAKALSDRIDIATKEIERLKCDGDGHGEIIEIREREISGLKYQLEFLESLIKDPEAVCPHCKASLIQSRFYPFPSQTGYGRMNQAIYACGRKVTDGKESVSCPAKP